MYITCTFIYIYTYTYIYTFPTYLQRLGTTYLDAFMLHYPVCNCIQTYIYICVYVYYI